MLEVVKIQGRISDIYVTTDNVGKDYGEQINKMRMRGQTRATQDRRKKYNCRDSVFWTYTCNGIMQAGADQRPAHRVLLPR